MAQTIAFIGLGNMGRPMAAHLQNAGHRLRIFARRPEVYRNEARSLIQNGAIACQSPAEAVNGAATVVTNVFSTDDVADVLIMSEESVVKGAAADTLCIDHSTIDPAGARAIARNLRTYGLHFIDAPVSGGIRAAQNGELTMMVGATERDLAAAKPLLECYARTITHVGDVGSGQVAKLCNQIAQVVTIQGVAEAMYFAGLNGTDPERVLAAISSGFAGSRMMDLMGPKMVARDFSAGIEARLHAKDLRLACGAAAELGHHLPAAEAVTRQLEDLMDRGWGRDDTSTLLRILESEEDTSADA